MSTIKTRKDSQVQEMMQDEVVMMCWENLDESQDKEPDEEADGEEKRLDEDKVNEIMEKPMKNMSKVQ